LRAFDSLKSRQGWQHQLLIIGDDKVGREMLLRYCDENELGSYVQIVPHMREELLPKVYGGADLLVLPSFEEGFGLPIIEAMACGTPVVCSEAASLPEVAADAAIFFDPRSHQELASCIDEVLGSIGLQRQLREKGFERAKYFSWRKCGERHADLYSQLVANNR
jgi:glycosyltransferase involved in cell wall biosynthesis